MRLLDLHFRCLVAAVHSREIIKRDWLLDAMTVVNEYTHNIKTKSSDGNGMLVKLNSVIELEKAITEAELGQVVCIDDKYLGIVFQDRAMLLSVAVLSQKG